MTTKYLNTVAMANVFSANTAASSSLHCSLRASTLRTCARAREIKSSLPALAGVAALALAATFASPAMAAGWWVDGVKGGDQYSAGTSSKPFSDIWMAAQAAAPGDTIYVVPSMTYPQLPVMTSGTATAPITVEGSNPAQPTKISGGGVSSGIWIDGNYLVVHNFDVTAPGNYPGISIAPNFHHVTVDGNIVHGAGGTGINTIANDYITITNNIVYGNANNTTTAFGSGISILASVDIDTYTGTKMRVKGNIVYNNSNIPRCPALTCTDSDGNGIILDDNQRVAFDKIPYKGGFLVADNVVYNNGGRGIHVFETDNALITGNTVYKNNQDPNEGFWHPGEVDVVSGGKVTFADNILYSDGLNGPNPTGTAPNYHVIYSFLNCNDGVGSINVASNLTYNPQANNLYLSYTKTSTNPITITANLFADPKFENAATANFQFKPGSPAIGAANLVNSVGVDILGAARMPTPSVGAYQNAGS